jgi:hypothetical protein
MNFLQKWGDAAYTSAGFFWMALWAFALGYLISSMIQIFVTRERMKRTMGSSGAKSIGLGTFFGFISSSCSFAALATTKSLFKKGAGLIPSLAFLLASTNLVIELGIVIAVFLSWHFIVGEYLGGLLLILITWGFVKLTKPEKLIQKVREKLNEGEEEKDDDEVPDWKERIRSIQGWSMVGKKYISEWRMVWKDVTIGFTVAGIIAAFVPSEAFQWLFIGTGVEKSASDLSFIQIVQHTLVGPIAAFMTFIGSMGNIPLASVLYNNGVSMAGIMAFIFSDLVVFPVLRINAKYYNWKMALYILLTLLVALVITSIFIHYGFEFLNLSPEAEKAKDVSKQSFFEIDYSFYLNIGFLIISGFLVWLSYQSKKMPVMEMANKGWVEQLLLWLSLFAYAWLAGGLAIKFIL